MKTVTGILDGSLTSAFLLFVTTRTIWTEGFLHYIGSDPLLSGLIFVVHVVSAVVAFIVLRPFEKSFERGYAVSAGGAFAGASAAVTFLIAEEGFWRIAGAEPAAIFSVARFYLALPTYFAVAIAATLHLIVRRRELDRAYSREITRTKKK